MRIPPWFILSAFGVVVVFGLGGIIIIILNRHKNKLT
jgi:hypothetical protein